MNIHKEIVNRMVAMGAVLIRSKNHEVWRLPNGARVVMSKTPGDNRRAMKNTMRDVRRAMSAGV